MVYASMEDRRERAGRSESAREEREEEIEGGKMEEREWIRERALEIDSHQECIGSSEVVVVVMVLGFGVVAVEDVDEDGELALWFWWNSIASFVGDSVTVILFFFALN